MDPIANLKEQRRLAAQILDVESQDWEIGQADVARDAVLRDSLRLAELVQALDEWMQHGGFSPWRDE